MRTRFGRAVAGPVEEPTTDAYRLPRAVVPRRYDLRLAFEGVLGLRAPEWEREVHAFFRRSAINLGGKTLGQYPEQLRIALRLREREGAVLSAYLARGKGREGKS